MQAALKKHGYLSGAADGIFGSATATTGCIGGDAKRLLVAHFVSLDAFDVGHALRQARTHGLENVPPGLADHAQVPHERLQPQGQLADGRGHRRIGNVDDHRAMHRLDRRHVLRQLHGDLRTCVDDPAAQRRVPGVDERLPHLRRHPFGTRPGAFMSVTLDPVDHPVVEPGKADAKLATRDGRGRGHRRIHVDRREHGFRTRSGGRTGRGRDVAITKRDELRIDAPAHHGRRRRRNTQTGSRTRWQRANCRGHGDLLPLMPAPYPAARIARPDIDASVRTPSPTTSRQPVLDDAHVRIMRPPPGHCRTVRRRTLPRVRSEPRTCTGRTVSPDSAYRTARPEGPTHAALPYPYFCSISPHNAGSSM